MHFFQKSSTLLNINQKMWLRSFLTHRLHNAVQLRNPLIVMAGPMRL